MVRRYGEPVEVRRGAVRGWSGPEAPQQFVWRGRLQVVREVQAHWITTTGAWWTSAAARAVHGLDPVDEVPVDEPVPGAPSPQGGHLRAHLPGVAVLDDPCRQVWRVEAAGGRDAARVVVDLALDEADGRWSLLRVHD